MTFEGNKSAFITAFCGDNVLLMLFPQIIVLEEKKIVEFYWTSILKGNGETWKPVCLTVREN